MIHVTERAGARIRALAGAPAPPPPAEAGFEGAGSAAKPAETGARGLRIKVVGGGCSGLSYKIDLDAEKKGDKVFEAGGGRVIVDRKSYLYLVGTTVDYAETLQNAGFQLDNPNVKSSCGCGESFVV
jgi:iron-sulfur cluster assembly protein